MDKADYIYVVGFVIELSAVIITLKIIGVFG